MDTDDENFGKGYRSAHNYSSSEYSKKHATVLQLDYLSNDQFAITADEKGQPCNVRAFIHF